MKFILSIIICTFSLLAVASEFEYTNYRLAYEPFRNETVVYSGVIARLLSGIPDPTNNVDSTAYEVLNAVFSKDIDKAYKLSCASRSECEAFIQQWQKYAPDFFKTKWNITRKEKIDDIIYYWLEDNSGQGISWRFKLVSDGILRWNPGEISNYIHFRVINSIRPEGDEMREPSKYSTDGLEKFSFSNEELDGNLSLYANLSIALSTNEIPNIKDITKYNRIFNQAAGENNHLDFKLDVLPKLEGEKWFFAILDADPLYIFWIPHIKKEGEINNSGLWVYEILAEQGEYVLQNKQSLIRDLCAKMIETKMISTSNSSHK